MNIKNCANDWEGRMPMRRKVDVIAIDWRGPFTYEQIRAREYLNGVDLSYDRGLYQIYGAQLQPETLIYVGETDGGFSTRIPAQEHWIEWEPHPTKIFLGKLANLTSGDKHSEILLRSETLIIYYCQPVMNIREKRAFSKIQTMPETVLINYGRRYLLPYVISNLIDQDDIYGVVGSTLGKDIAKAKGETTQ
jgi:hypothetical protein